MYIHMFKYEYSRCTTDVLAGPRRSIGSPCIHSRWCCVVCVCVCVYIHMNIHYILKIHMRDAHSLSNCSLMLYT